MARTRPGIRVHLSIADHDKTSEVWSNLEQRGMLVELWRKAGDKFAGKRDDQVPLKPTDRMDIACSSCIETADKMLFQLCRKMKYGVRKYPNRWVVTIRNFTKKQGYQPPELNTVPGSVSTENSTPTSPSPNTIPIPSPKNNSDTDTRGAESLSRSPSAKTKKTICPDRLDEPDRQKLLAWAATRDFTESHVRWGFNVVKDWSQSKAETRADWVATIRNAMRDGWGLKGYTETDSEKYRREIAASPLANPGGQPDAQ